MGFLGPETNGMLEQLGVKMTDRGNVWRDAQLDDERARRVRRRRHAARPVAHRLGDRRRPMGARAASTLYLMGKIRSAGAARVESLLRSGLMAQGP